MRTHVLIPAGGTGSRFGAPVPKQFLTLQGRLVLEWSLEPFLQHAQVAHVWLALPDHLPEAAESALERLRRRHPGRLHCLACAGETRALTVANALETIAERWEQDDPWILVHDAARPGLSAAALQRLLDALIDEPVGALLALPVADTLKRAAPASAQTQAVRVDSTVAREGLWQAQTPQAFRLQLLRVALARTGASAGDEASAIEGLGQVPRLVMGEAQNLKLTHPQDADLLSALLAAREAACG